MISPLMVILMIVCWINVWMLRLVSQDKNMGARILRFSIGVEAVIIGAGALLVYVNGLSGLAGTIMASGVLIQKLGYVIYKTIEHRHAIRDRTRVKMEQAMERRDEIADQLHEKVNPLKEAQNGTG